MPYKINLPDPFKDMTFINFAKFYTDPYHSNERNRVKQIKYKSTQMSELREPFSGH